MDENLNHESGSSAAPVVHVIPTVDGSRRRFTSAGLAATGVVMTLASRPVLGCTSAEGALSPSGWSSINASRCTGANSTVALGLSHGYWKEHPTAWPAGVTPDTLCSAKFPIAAGPLSSTTLTMQQALELGGNGSAFAREIVCGYLNALSGKTTPYLKVTDVVKMASGSFTPSTGGLAWDSGKIVTYLLLTHD